MLRNYLKITIINEGNFFFIEWFAYDFRIINKEVIIKLKDHYSISLNELTNDHQWLLALQKERRLDIIFLLVEVHITIYTVLPKLTLNLFNLLGWTTNFQEIQRTKEQIKIHNTNTVSSLSGNNTTKDLASSTK